MSESYLMVKIIIINQFIYNCKIERTPYVLISEASTKSLLNTFAEKEPIAFRQVAAVDMHELV